MIKSMIRRLDEFGRITLPCEMRRAMRLEESDPIEIVYENRRITVFPCIRLNEMEYLMLPCLKALKKCGDSHTVFTAPKEICLSGLDEAERGTPLSDELVSVLRKRKDHIPEDFSIPLTSHGRYAVTAVFPILSAGDLHGGIVIVTDDGTKPAAEQLIRAKFLRDILVQEAEET